MNERAKCPGLVGSNTCTWGTRQRQFIQRVYDCTVCTSALRAENEQNIQLLLFLFLLLEFLSPHFLLLAHQHQANLSLLFLYFSEIHFAFVQRQQQYNFHCVIKISVQYIILLSWVRKSRHQLHSIITYILLFLSLSLSLTFPIAKYVNTLVYCILFLPFFYYLNFFWCLFVFF